MKTLSALLAERQMLLHRARLANLAFAYHTLRDYAARIGNSRLRGTVTLKQAAPTADRYWATLTAVDFSQAVVEEHFSDENTMELADLLEFITGNDMLDATFRLEELGDTFLHPLRQALEREGVAIDGTNPPSDARTNDRHASSS